MMCFLLSGIKYININLNLFKHNLSDNPTPSSNYNGVGNHSITINQIKSIFIDAFKKPTPTSMCDVYEKA
jgi:hypothetical protein